MTEAKLYRPRGDDETTTLNISLPSRLKALIVAQAKARRMSVSHFVAVKMEQATRDDQEAA